MPRIPATIPKTPPTRNPPPVMKLSTANGNVISAPIGPRLINIIMPPVITVNPETRPMRVAIDCPRPDGPPNHQKIPDQLVGGPQNPGESNAAAFTSISIADASANTNAQIALFPVNDGLEMNDGLEIAPGLAIPPTTTAPRLRPQYGQ
jgi:hypothetical protein